MANILEIPEILLSIFSNCDSQKDFYNFELVARAWHLPARSFLYRNLAFTWRYSHVAKLLRSFEDDLTLGELVVKCDLTDFQLEDLEAELREGLLAEGRSEGEVDDLLARRKSNHGRELPVAPLVKAHPDSVWMIYRGYHWWDYPEYIAFANFLTRLVNLRHLVLANGFNPVEWGGASPTLSTIVNNICKLSLCDARGDIALWILSEGSSVDHLNLIEMGPASLDGCEKLRHLVIEDTKADGGYGSSFSSTLETLDVVMGITTFNHGYFTTDLTHRGAFTRLTYLRLVLQVWYQDEGRRDQEESVKWFLDILKFLNHLQHLTVLDGPPLLAILPSLPPTLHTIEASLEYHAIKPDTTLSHILSASAPLTSLKTLHLYLRWEVSGVDWAELPQLSDKQAAEADRRGIDFTVVSGYEDEWVEMIERDRMAQLWEEARDLRLGE